MVNHECIAQLRRENRLLRAMLDLAPGERRLLARLAEGPASREDLMAVVEARRGDAVTQHAVYRPILAMRRKLKPHGMAIVAARPGQCSTGFKLITS